jgi:hypothetical protein
MEVFKRNKKFYGALMKQGETDYWIANQPLFICGDKGLFPVFRTGGPTGVFPKNHQQLILKKLGEEDVRSRQNVSKRKDKDILNKI